MLVNGITDVVAIAAGDFHSLALTSDGTVWAWGGNNRGQLGNPGLVQSATPVQVAGLTDVVAIAAGSEHSIALKADGTMWSWGRNDFGQLGDGSGSDRHAPVLATSVPGPAISIGAKGNRTSVVDANGALIGFGMVEASLVAPVVRATPAYFGSLAIGTDGTVWVSGTNDRGQLGTGNTDPLTDHQPLVGINNVSAIDSGGVHTIALRTDGTVWAWGGNDAGQLGDGTTPCPTGLDLGCPGRQYSATPQLVNGPSDVVAISANNSQALAISSDGRVWAWGRNDARQLGDGTLRTRTVPAQTSEPGLTWRTATPALLVGGTYVEVVQTAGTSATPGAVVHYTTNGNDPIESDPVFPSGLLSITQTTTLKARAWAAGKPPSSIAVDTYTLQVPLPVSSPSGFFEEYGAPVNVTLSTLPLTGVTIYYTLDGSTPAIGAPGTFTYSSPITLTTQTLLRFFGVKPGWTNGDVRSVLYRFNYGTLAAPTITPSAGTYVYGEPVTLTAIAGATIRYTTDGSTPSPSSSAYTGPIALTGAMTLRAVAFHTDWRDSPVASAAFVAQAATPLFSPDAGTLHGRTTHHGLRPDAGGNDSLHEQRSGPDRVRPDHPEWWHAASRQLHAEGSRLQSGSGPERHSHCRVRTSR